MRVIITDNDHKDIDIESKILAEAGVSFELKQCKTEEDLIEQCKDTEIFINQYAPITRRVMEALPNLKYVVRYGVGVNNVDVVAATELGVQVGNVPDYGMNEVADHAIALMMSLVRKVVSVNTYTKTNTWDYIQSIPIHRCSTQTVGVVGLGRIGRNFAEKAHALGFKIIGFDKFLPKDKFPDFVEPVGIEELQERSDVISIHCPSDGNIDLFDKQAFQRMKKSAYIINCARGGIINEDDLLWALENKEIAGAGIDCVTKEPMLPGSPLLDCDNYVVTPHMGWYSEEAAEELNRKIAEEAVRFAKGQAIHYPVNQPAHLR